MDVGHKERSIGEAPLVSKEFVADPIILRNREYLLQPDLLQDYFKSKNYLVREPKPVCNKERDTIFITAGVQGVMQDFSEGQIPLRTPLYIAQPVIRTQYIDSLGEGCSVCFTNISTVEFGNSFERHEQLVADWLQIFSELGIPTEAISYRDKSYSRMWGDQHMAGYKVFYYYDGVEIGDSTYFDKVRGYNGELTSMSDVGFGLERLRWLIGGGSYYDLIEAPEATAEITAEEIALCSGLALLAKDGIRPSNKHDGYRFRQFSKRLVSQIGDDRLASVGATINNWLDYWSLWSTNSVPNEEAFCQITKENERNMNRILLDRLSELGCPDGQNIDINLPRGEFLRRLANSSAIKYLDIAS